MTPPVVERKLAAILSADVKGYSRLMGDDEVSTVRTLTAHREVMATSIQQHRGRVVDAPGDNLLAEFASVVDAVECAADLQRELGSRNTALPTARRMEFRIGINLGDVIVDGERSTATASTSQRAWKAWRTPAASRSPGPSTTRSRASSRSTSRTWAGRPSRTSASRFGSTGSASTRPPPVAAASSGGSHAGARSCRWRSSCSWLRSGRRRHVLRPDAFPCSRIARQALDRRAAVPEHERRREPGVLQRRDDRGPHHRAVQAVRPLRDRAKLGVRLQGQDGQAGRR